MKNSVIEFYGPEDINIHTYGELKKVIIVASHYLLDELHYLIEKYAYMDDSDRMKRAQLVAERRESNARMRSATYLYDMSDMASRESYWINEYPRTGEFWEAWSIKRPRRIMENRESKEYVVHLEYDGRKLTIPGPFQHESVHHEDMRDALAYLLNKEGPSSSLLWNYRKGAYWDIFENNLYSLWDDCIYKAKVELGYY